MGLYETLKAAKIGAASDVFTTLRGRQAPFAKGGSTEKEYTGTVPVTINSDGSDIISWYLKGNMEQTGTPTNANPIYPSECGDLSSGNYIIPITTGNNTTNINLNTVQSTRLIKKIVLTGEEEFTSTSVKKGLVYLYDPSPAVPNAYNTADNIISSHFKAERSNQTGNIYFNSSRMVFVNFTLTSIEEFQTYLQQQYNNGTPVTVWYVLATPTTGVLNEPLRKIGNYADSISDVATIPTDTGSQTFDVDTTLQPSSVYIKYKE